MKNSSCVVPRRLANWDFVNMSRNVHTSAHAQIFICEASEAAATLRRGVLGAPRAPCAAAAAGSPLGCVRRGQGCGICSLGAPSPRPLRTRSALGPAPSPVGLPDLTSGWAAPVQVPCEATFLLPVSHSLCCPMAGRGREVDVGFLKGKPRASFPHRHSCWA